ncbi:MAG: Lar family restriction alleviation protein [Rhizobium sp.]|uniref:Lar family restriction alleviation protein n=1 Tax=Rhizobium sp. TaxID=391 RepID=UPI0030F0F01F
MNIVEVNDCPFCGGKSRLVKREGFGPAGGKFSRGYVSCNKCGINTPSKSPWQKAVNLWNRRSALTNTSGDDEAPVAITDDLVRYISRYGGRCRDCADEDGVCPTSGLPCGGADKAIRHVLKALNYGAANGFIAARPQSAAVRDEAQIALEILTRAAADVAKHGATTGPQWVKLNMAIIKAKSALHSTQEG